MIQSFTRLAVADNSGAKDRPSSLWEQNLCFYHDIPCPGVAPAGHRDSGSQCTRPRPSRPAVRRSRQHSGRYGTSG